MTRSDMGRRRMNLTTSSEKLSEVKIIPGFIDEVALECLVRVGLDYGTLHVVRKVCKKWRELFSDDDDGILVMRRARDLQQPSMFLIPCEDSFILGGRSEFACATYKSNILILGGRRDKRALREVWIIDILNRKVRRETNMLEEREFLVAAAVGDCLFAIGGESLDGQFYEPSNTVECYDFVTERWGYVSSLPFCTIPERCYVDRFSSSTTELFVSGQSYNEVGLMMDGEYSYCTSNDTWEELDVTSYQSPVLPRPLKWMWCTGTMLFEKEMRSYKEQGDDAVLDDDDEAAAVLDEEEAAVSDKEDEEAAVSDDEEEEEEEEEAVSDEEAAAWKFPSEITIPANVATALIQPTTGSAKAKNPLISKSLTGKSILFSDEENETRSALMSITVVPNNAEFYPLSVISRVERTSMIAHTVPMNAMRDDMFFPKPIQGASHTNFSCLFAVLFF